MATLVPIGQSVLHLEGMREIVKLIFRGDQAPANFEDNWYFALSHQLLLDPRQRLVDGGFSEASWGGYARVAVPRSAAGWTIEENVSSQGGVVRVRAAPPLVWTAPPSGLPTSTINRLLLCSSADDSGVMVASAILQQPAVIAGSDAIVVEGFVFEVQLVAG